MKKYKIEVLVDYVNFKNVNLKYEFTVNAENLTEASDRADEIIKNEVQADLEEKVYSMTHDYLYIKEIE